MGLFCCQPFSQPLFISFFAPIYFIPYSMVFLKKYLSSLYIPICWTLLIGILLSLPGSMIPDEGKFRIPNFDKIVHIGLFGCFVFLWCLRVSTRGFSQKKRLTLFFGIFILAAAYGIGMEYVQKYFIPNRDFELGDIIADLIGASLAYGVSNLAFLE